MTPLALYRTGSRHFMYTKLPVQKRGLLFGCLSDSLWRHNCCRPHIYSCVLFKFPVIVSSSRPLLANSSTERLCKSTKTPHSAESP